MRLKIDKLFLIPAGCSIIAGILLFLITFEIGVCIVCAMATYVTITVVVMLND